METNESRKGWDGDGDAKEITYEMKALKGKRRGLHIKATTTTGLLSARLRRGGVFFLSFSFNGSTRYNSARTPDKNYKQVQPH